MRPDGAAAAADGSDEDSQFSPATQRQRRPPAGRPDEASPSVPGTLHPGAPGPLLRGMRLPQRLRPLPPAGQHRRPVSAAPTAALQPAQLQHDTRGTDAAALAAEERGQEQNGTGADGAGSRAQAEQGSSSGAFSQLASGNSVLQLAALLAQAQAQQLLRHQAPPPPVMHVWQQAALLAAAPCHGQLLPQQPSWISWGRQQLPPLQQLQQQSQLNLTCLQAATAGSHVLWLHKMARELEQRAWELGLWQAAAQAMQQVRLGAQRSSGRGFGPGVACALCIHFPIMRNAAYRML